MDCAEKCVTFATCGPDACGCCGPNEKLMQICSQIKTDCENGIIPISCDKPAGTDCSECTIKAAAIKEMRKRLPWMIWAESGCRVLDPVDTDAFIEKVLHPEVQAEVEQILADHAREMEAEQNAFSYLTQDEGKTWGSE